ncbi:MAG: GNAT family N-acetyltransferase [Ktedonobacteraceae bacterium]|nr:GNAT family N-acetyltransferase [Ktedonobacteraceae bacterium]
MTSDNITGTRNDCKGRVHKERVGDGQQVAWRFSDRTFSTRTRWVLDTTPGTRTEGETEMIIRLHNLSARAPQMKDLRAVTELMKICDEAEGYDSDITEDELRRAWLAEGFSLRTDAWVIATRTGQIAGYAEVRREEGRGDDSEDERLAALLRVHPDYRGRGIGTLLIWLLEERARQVATQLSQEKRVVLYTRACGDSRVAHHLFEREGYVAARHLWRLVIDMDEAPVDERQPGRVQVDLEIDTQNLLSTMPTRRTGIYTARQYIVYEKTLRPASKQLKDLSQDISLPQAVS